ncbi:hypothetical protein SR41_16820 [Sphingomonas melonis]|uniref:Uncharacterized protein n=1 Tax=Sphingomonas melonis TaxID=152682 RepID=A0A0D1ME59_9SPHN|nr:hypothetical protein SR41_16820 [Sphingomonas melonis]
MAAIAIAAIAIAAIEPGILRSRPIGMVTIPMGIVAMTQVLAISSVPTMMSVVTLISRSDAG